MAKKYPAKLDIILNKIDEISVDPQHYKNLKKPLQHLKRVHVDSSFGCYMTLYYKIISKIRNKERK